ncbi:MAG: hypothetical protein AAFV88_08795 [Planctomycetota bacterium]
MSQELEEKCLWDAATPAHLEYFGFALIDVGWDDPSDTQAKVNYLDEVARFSNLADMLVAEPNDRIEARLDAFAAVNVKAVIHLNYLLFEQVGTNAPSGADFDLRGDFRQRWDAFVKLNKRQHEIAALYIGEEPTWNGVAFEELREVADYLKASLPETKLMLVEAFPALRSLIVPKTIDWVGFDHYFISDIEHDAAFQAELNLLKKKRSADHQRIILIPDAHFIPEVHRHFGVTRDKMVGIADAYCRIAAEDEDVIGLMAYFWPGGFDDPTALGTRQMSDVKNQYRKIGRRITGK